MSSDLLTLILWGIYDRYYRRNPDRRLADGEGKHAVIEKDLTEAITNDILAYCQEHYVIAGVNNDHIDRAVIDLIASAIAGTEEEEKIEARSKSPKTDVNPLITTRAYEGFKTRAAIDYHNANKELTINLSRSQLEALCLYSHDVSYTELCKRKHIFYTLDGHLQLVKTNLRPIFVPILQHMFDAMHAASSRCKSPILMHRTCEMFVRETRRLFDAVEKDTFFVPAEDYLEELKLLMQDAEGGFGVSIPKWNKNWESSTGMEILEINKLQSEGFPENGKPSRIAFPYRRIFLLEAKAGNPNTLNKDDHAMILHQLSKNVLVYVIFKEAWKQLDENQLDSLDFAVIKIEGAPTLMSTRFNGTLAEGTFSTDPQKPGQHYNDHLAKILNQANRDHIFEAKLKGKGIELAGPLSAGDIDTLSRVLREIYTLSST
jgi:hypothetical protein